jgi:hypothetical protein
MVSIQLFEQQHSGLLGKYSERDSMICALDMTWQSNRLFVQPLPHNVQYKTDLQKKHACFEFVIGHAKFKASFLTSGGNS